MEGMNAVPDPEDPEERKGCSGHIAKLIISENEQEKKIAMVAYVPEDMKDKLNAIEWMKAVCETELGGGVGGAPRRLLPTPGPPAPRSRTPTRRTSSSSR